jgi:hypothetical protein
MNTTDSNNSASNTTNNTTNTITNTTSNTSNNDDDNFVIHGDSLVNMADYPHGYPHFAPPPPLFTTSNITNTVANNIADTTPTSSLNALTSPYHTTLGRFDAQMSPSHTRASDTSSNSTTNSINSNSSNTVTNGSSSSSSSSSNSSNTITNGSNSSSSSSTSSSSQPDSIATATAAAQAIANADTNGLCLIIRLLCPHPKPRALTPAEQAATPKPRLPTPVLCLMARPLRLLALQPPAGGNDLPAAGTVLWVSNWAHETKTTGELLSITLLLHGCHTVYAVITLLLWVSNWAHETKSFGE